MSPLTKKGKKIMSSMKKQYGTKKGKQVFYASENKGTISGVHKKVDIPNRSVHEIHSAGKVMTHDVDFRSGEWGQVDTPKKATGNNSKGLDISLGKV